MTFTVIQSDFMILFAIAILFMLLLSELLAHDYDAQVLLAENKKRASLSWVLGIVAWLLGIIFFAVFLLTIF